MRVALAFGIFTILLSTYAYGFMGGDVKYKWWKNEKIVAEMGLSEQQVRNIEKIFRTYKEQIVEYQRQLNKKESELGKKLKNPQCSREEVLEITDDIENIRASLTRIKVEMFLGVKSVLTAEQEKILHGIRARYKSKRRLNR